MNRFIPEVRFKRFLPSTGLPLVGKPVLKSPKETVAHDGKPTGVVFKIEQKNQRKSFLSMCMLRRDKKKFLWMTSMLVTRIWKLFEDPACVAILLYPFARRVRF